ncbi:MAG: CoA-binding protein, partial [Deltaproteobacteria bacterium]|nr:CoA-binding protein [Deltaproteobacteria bacterium]
MRADLEKLDRAFNPRCIVVIGDSGRFQWLHAHRKFTGKLYSVHLNPKTSETITKMGFTNYSSLLDIPDQVDLAIVAVNRKASLAVLEDLIKKDVAGAHFFTSGFSETHTDEGARLEKLLKKRAEEANFNLIGPNCMGLFVPRHGVKQGMGQYDDVSGPMGFISQSGTHALNFALEARLQGLNINKSVSFGNGTVLDSAEFLDYFGQDDEIKIIGMYLEGVRDGRRFLEVLREVSARKPVVIWKGGRTEGGSRAIASHTGSLAVPRTVWNAVMKQHGAVNVNGVDQLIDAIKALMYLSPVKGNRVAIAGGSGGQSVDIADAANEAGLDVPPLTRESYDELETFYNIIGGGYDNPIDTGNSNRMQLIRIMDIIERDVNIDNIVMMIGTGQGGSPSKDSNAQDMIPGGP